MAVEERIGRDAVPPQMAGTVPRLFHAYLPLIPVWSRCGGARHLIRKRMSPDPYMREGHRVRITQGRLAGIEGVLLQHKAHKGLLVVSVDLLQRSVAVEVDCMFVAPGPLTKLSCGRSSATSPADLQAFRYGGTR